MAQLGKGLLGRLIGAGVAIVIALGIVFAFNKYQEKDAEGDAPKVGDCLQVTGTVNADHTEYDCGDPKSTYKVASDDGKCDETEVPYKISLGDDADSGNVADLCLGLDAAKGDCFELSSTGEKKVDCASTKGKADVYRILSVGKAGAKCATPGQPVENKVRKTQVCVDANA